ncbi:MAG: DinB family protein [Gemmatimonadota bacterium]
MSIAQSLLPEFDHETASTRKYLAVTPAAAAGWKPHAKSMGLGALAMHIVEVPDWAVVTLTQPEFDVAPPGGPGYQPTPFTTTEDLLERFDAMVPKVRQALEHTADAAFTEPWTFKAGGAVIFTMPRIAVYRSFIMNHLIHHRGQYSVYLRMNGVALPEMYGPTADSV